MRTIISLDEMQSFAAETRKAGKRIGFVPTMGYLHEGHLSLVRLARERSDVVVMSVFVNPTQFGPSEDFDRYPRDMERDSRLAAEAGADILFTPAKEAMYPVGYSTYVSVEGLTSRWEGAIRPTHFRGVTTIVHLLFTMVKPHVAVFGQKDIQQAIVLRTMIRDLRLDVEMVIAPIVREADGLAMSSRNVYLTPAQRAQAPLLRKSLDRAEAMINAGERNAREVLTGVSDVLHGATDGTIDYATIVDTQRMEEAERLDAGRTYVVALAVRFGTTRLIDNSLVTIPQ